MQNYQGGKVADQYLLQRLEGASPEQLHAMLLEAGQKFLGLAIVAMNNRDTAAKSRHFSRVSAIIVELRGRLNHEEGGELVLNLTRIYQWWIDVLFESSLKNEPERLQLILNQMAEMRATWEEVHNKKTSAAQAVNTRASLDGMVG